MDSDSLAAALKIVDGVDWGVVVLDFAADGVQAGFNAGAGLRTASVGKILLLTALSEQLERGDIDPDERLDRRDVEPVGDSGLWQYLRTDTLPVGDVATLIAAVSDNLATNVLLDRLGLEACARVAERRGLTATALHDYVRDQRTSSDPPALSTSSARDLVRLLVQLRTDAVGARVLRWLLTGTDLSMVASAFGLDPLAHAGRPDRGVLLLNKTGTDDGVRADVGLVRRGSREVAYAVIANWDPAAGDPRDDVLDTMRAIGSGIRNG